MTIYVAIWLIIYLFSLINVNKVQGGIVTSISAVLYILLVLFIGSRFNTGPDVEVYNSYFNQAPNVLDGIFNYRQYAYIPVEPFYLFVNSAFKSLGLNFNGFLLSFSALFILPIFVTIKRYSIMPVFSVMIYFYYGYFSGFSAIRQVMAAAIFFYSIKFLINQNFLKYLFCIILAACFHISALILLPLYFFVNKVFSVQVILIVVFSTIAMRHFDLFNILSYQIANLLSFSPITLLLYSKFMTYSIANNSFWGSVTLEWIIVLLISLFNRRKIQERVPYFNIFFNIFFIGLVMYAFFGAFGDFGRIIIYFKLSYIIIIPGLIVLFDDFKMRFILITFVSFIVLLRVYISIISDDKFPGVFRNRYLPYKSWLMN